MVLLMSFYFQDNQRVRPKGRKNIYRVEIRGTARGIRAFLSCDEFYEKDEFTNGVRTISIEAEYHTISLPLHETGLFEVIE